MNPLVPHDDSLFLITVPCADCGHPLTLTRDANRGHLDRGTRPAHATCPAVVQLATVPRPAAAPRPTRAAAEVVLLAAADLTAAGTPVFSEWDLTVAAWSLDRRRFGLRGFETSYPDHKRVYAEIVAGKRTSLTARRLLEKTRPNHYRLTAAGRAAAARLRAT